MAPPPNTEISQTAYAILRIPHSILEVAIFNLFENFKLCFKTKRSHEKRQCYTKKIIRKVATYFFSNSIYHSNALLLRGFAILFLLNFVFKLVVNIKVPSTVNESDWHRAITIYTAI